MYSASLPGSDVTLYRRTGRTYDRSIDREAHTAPYDMRGVCRAIFFFSLSLARRSTRSAAQIRCHRGARQGVYSFDDFLSEIDSVNLTAAQHLIPIRAALLSLLLIIIIIPLCIGDRGGASCRAWPRQKCGRAHCLTRRTPPSPSART